jgi:hypothetical protein
MSSYHNSFYEGPSDKPAKKKPVRTNHSTWGDIINDITPGSDSAKKVRDKSKEAMEKANVD